MSATLTSLKNPFALAMDLRKVLTTAPPKLDSVLPGLLAGTVGVCAAAGGAGKTTFLLQTCFAIATGSDLCGGLFDDVPEESSRTREPAKVVFVCAEESVAILWHRIHAIAQFLFRQTENYDKSEAMRLLDLIDENLLIYPLQGVQGMAMLDMDHLPTETFRHLVNATKSARLIVLDPLRQFHSGDENSSLSMNAMVQLLQHLAVRSGAAVIVAHHTNRASTLSGNGDTAGAARGSTALTDGARWQMNLSRPSFELLKEYGVGGKEHYRYLALNIAKANYLAPYSVQLLQRVEGGALCLVPAPVTGRFRPINEERQPRGMSKVIGGVS